MFLNRCAVNCAVHLRREIILSDTQRLPNLYQLLGLSGPEDSLEKISAAVKRAHAKMQTLKADTARTTDAARLQKIVALAQKYLLNGELKSSYDAQWNSIYGSTSTQPTSAASTAAVDKSALNAATATTATTNTTASIVATPVATKPVEASAATATSELIWDMSALDALLPPADPHAPFQMSEYLRTSEVRDPLAAEADLRKLITLLGGEVESLASPTQSRASQSLAIALEPEPLPTDTGLTMPRSTSAPPAAAALASRMRRKRQRAILFGGTGLAAALVGLVLLSVYLKRPATEANQPVAKRQVTPPPSPLPPVPQPDKSSNGNAPDNTPAANPSDSGLIQPGENVKPLQIQATPLPEPAAMAMPDKPAAEPMKPEPMKPEPMKPEPQPEPTKPQPTPEPTKPEPAPTKPEPATPEPAKPAAPAADVKLTDKEKKSWQDEMKRVRAGLSKLDPATSEKQIEGLKSAAKTSQQQSQLATLEQAAGLVRKAREALVAAIGGLESAETFMVGNSTEVSFVEGDETRIIVRVSRGRKEYKLDAIPAKMAVVMMKMEPNVVDSNLEAAMGAYIMVQAKKVNDVTAEGKKFLEDAAATGAISKELAQFYEEDYKLQ